MTDPMADAKRLVEEGSAISYDRGDQVFFFLDLNEEKTDAYMFSIQTDYEYEDYDALKVTCVWIIQRSYLERMTENYNGISLPVDDEGKVEYLPYF